VKELIKVLGSNTVNGLFGIEMGRNGKKKFSKKAKRFQYRNLLDLSIMSIELCRG
jgi:hypothetical protein